MNSKSGCGKYLFFTSVGLNFFLLGVLLVPVFGHALFLPLRPGMDGPEGPGGPAAGMIEDVARQLEAPEAARLRAIFRETVVPKEASYGEMQIVMKNVAAILREERPDTQALAAELGRISRVGEKMHESMSAMLLRAASELSAASRRILADTLERGPPAGPPGRGR